MNAYLVTTGPYALMRHPMYVGFILSALGSLLLYTTWTTVYFACFAPLMFVRAWREEQTLAAEFGDQWQQYSRRVPAYIPRLRKDVSMMSETKPLDRRQSRRAAEIESNMQSEVEIRQWKEHS